MKTWLGLAMAAGMALLAGCASTQKPVALSFDALSSQPTNVGVVLSAVPKADTQFPGANCLLCIAAANVVHSSLTSYANGLTFDELAAIAPAIVDRLKANGIDAKVIDERVRIDGLPTIRGASAGQPNRDFSSIGAKYDVDRLVVIDVTLLGFERPYAAYIPTGDPKAFITGRGYLIDLKGQKYEWYEPLRITHGSDGAWDEPPKYPGLTNAFYQTLEEGKDRFVRAFDAKAP